MICFRIPQGWILPTKDEAGQKRPTTDTESFPRKRMLLRREVGRVVGRCDAGRVCTPARVPCVRMAMHSIPQLPQRTCDLPKSSTGGSQQTLGDRLVCVIHDLPTRLPMLGPSQGITFQRTCLQLMSFFFPILFKIGVELLLNRCVGVAKIFAFLLAVCLASVPGRC